MTLYKLLNLSVAVSFIGKMEIIVINTGLLRELNQLRHIKYYARKMLTIIIIVQKWQLLLWLLNKCFPDCTPTKFKGSLRYIKGYYKA